MKKFLDCLFLTLGLALFLYGSYMVLERHVPHTVASENHQTTEVSTIPTSIRIQSANINLPIYPSVIEGKVWQTTAVGVSYLASSPLPGQLGNSVMYGHNWPNLLKNLSIVEPGDVIEITYGPDRVLQYVVHFVSVVTPDETHIYKNTDDFRLTIYTCTGFLDSKRLVVTAILAS